MSNVQPKVFRPFCQLTPPQRRDLLLDCAKSGDLEIVKILTQKGYVDPRYKKNKALRLAIEHNHHDIIYHLMTITNTERKWASYDRLANKCGHLVIEERFCWDYSPHEIEWAEGIFDDPNKIWA